MNFKIQLIRPQAKIRKFVYEKWNLALGDLEKWMKKDLVRALVFGGMGIQGIAQTNFYKFVTSPEGLSQLGIEKSEPPKLLKAYESRAFTVKKSKRVISLKFGNVAKLKAATPHPASGTGKLKISSWLEWIVDKRTVSGYGFVARKDIPERAHKHIRLGAPIGGLMLSRGAFKKSVGTWKFPAEFVNYERDWLVKNAKVIESVILNQMVKLFQKRLSA